MSLPPNIATPTLITGKTSQSQVVDVYSSVPAVQDNVAQNSISSVLAGAVNSLFGNTISGAMKVLESDRFVKDMTGVIDKIKTSDMSSDSVKNILKEYKNGALSTILEANGVKEVGELKDNILSNVSTNVKNIAFGSVKGIVDNIVPGVLDESGIKSFDDCQKIYSAISDDIRSLNRKTSNTTEVYIDESTSTTLAVSSLVLDSCIDIINNILEPSKRITKTTDTDIDNAVLVSATASLIKDDNPEMNKYILDSFGDNTDALNLFVSTTINDAAKLGAFSYINEAGKKTSPQFASWAISTPLEDFSTALVIPRTLTEEERLAKETEVISAFEIVSKKKKTKFTPATFAKLSNSAYELLKYGTYGTLIGVGKNLGTDSATDIIANNFSDFIIT